MLRILSQTSSLARISTMHSTSKLSQIQLLAECTHVPVGLLSLWLSSLLRNYVDETTAKRLNLTFASSDTFILRADYTTTLNSNGPGRNSVRIRTNNVYTTHVVVSVLFFFLPLQYTLYPNDHNHRFNIRHMPQGCG